MFAAIDDRPLEVVGGEAFARDEDLRVDGHEPDRREVLLQVEVIGKMIASTWVSHCPKPMVPPAPATMPQARLR